MAEQRSADVGFFDETTEIQIVPPPLGEFDLYLPAGGLFVQNADDQNTTFTLRIKKGSAIVEIFSTELSAGEGFAWPFPIRIAPDFDGIFGVLSGAINSVQPTWFWHGFLLPAGVSVNPINLLAV